MPTSGNIFFASDFHLGIPDREQSLEREKKVVQWLDETSSRATAYYLLGDLFDFWFEYRKAVPQGYVRLLGKLAELSDKGKEIHIFTGNHDLWMDGYLATELNATLYKAPVTLTLKGKTFYLAHGDGLGPGDTGFKIMKRLFTNKLAQRLFRLLHPDWGIALANYFSGRSRMANLEPASSKIDPEKEMQVHHAREILTHDDEIDYFIFGHRHIPYEFALNEYCTLLNLGDWMRHFTYAEFDGHSLDLKSYHG